MRLHLLGLPHTVTTQDYSHCAFTGKVLRFPSMMRPLGYDIIHYGVAGAETEANEHVDLMTRDEQNFLRGHDDSDRTRFTGTDANTGSKLYKEFNRRLRQALLERVAQADLVLLPFGHAHADALGGLPFLCVESGIGYPVLYAGAEFKIFESYAWLHYHLGEAKATEGRNYQWAIPNYFDITEWEPRPNQGNRDTVVFLGRIGDLKGMPTVVEVARQRPDLQFLICGQGDPKPYVTLPNIKYVPPITGRARSILLGHALAVIMPTKFIEPFAGVSVEAQLTGTPVLSTTWGAFTETIEDEVTGFRCHTLGDFLAGLERVRTLDRQYIADRARRLYGYERVGKMYDRAFQQIADLRGPGWFSTRSVFGEGKVTAQQETRDPWAVAQEREREYHLNIPLREHEAAKRKHYAHGMGIDWNDLDGKRIIDIGSGPESLLLGVTDLKAATALDPLRFADNDEALYEQLGIARLIQPAEELQPPAELYDEAWIYNCLQHVQSPERVLVQAARAAKRIRIWEWCNIPTDQLHLHVLTAERIRATMQAVGWVAEAEAQGRWNETTPGGMNGDYYAAVWQNPAHEDLSTYGDDDFAEEPPDELTFTGAENGRK